jgi:hypothetical protein
MDFLKIQSPEDYEKFCEIKDNIILNKDLS